MGTKRDFLVNKTDAQPLGGQGVFNFHLAAVDENFAGVGSVDAIDLKVDLPAPFSPTTA